MVVHIVSRTQCNGEGKKRKINDTRKEDDSEKKTEDEENGINENGQRNETKEEVIKTCSKPKKKKIRNDE